MVLPALHGGAAPTHRDTGARTPRFQHDGVVAVQPRVPGGHHGGTGQLGRADRTRADDRRTTGHGLPPDLPGGRMTSSELAGIHAPYPG